MATVEGACSETSERNDLSRKVLAPLCLSYHPETPPDEAQVIKRAKKFS
jgi:hypothetical protein